MLPNNQQKPETRDHLHTVWEGLRMVGNREAGRGILRIIRGTRKAVGNILWNDVPNFVGPWQKVYPNQTTIAGLSLATLLGLGIGGIFEKHIAPPPKRSGEKGPIERVIVSEEELRLARGTNPSDVRKMKESGVRSIPSFAIMEKLSKERIWLPEGEETEALVQLRLEESTNLAFGSSFAAAAKDDKERSLLHLVHPQLKAFIRNELDTFLTGLKEQARYANDKDFSKHNYKVLFTSAGRPEEYQERLRSGTKVARNRNAAPESIHTRGANATDMVYASLLDTSVHPPKEVVVRKGSMEEDFMNDILKYLAAREKEGTIFFAREKSQPCYHLGMWEVVDNTEPVAEDIKKVVEARLDAERKATAEKLRKALEKKNAARTRKVEPSRKGKKGKLSPPGRQQSPGKLVPLQRSSQPVKKPVPQSKGRRG